MGGGVRPKGILLYTTLRSQVSCFFCVRLLRLRSLLHSAGRWGKGDEISCGSEVGGESVTGQAWKRCSHLTPIPLARLRAQGPIPAGKLQCHCFPGRGASKHACGFSCPSPLAHSAYPPGGGLERTNSSAQEPIAKFSGIVKANC